MKSAAISVGEGGKGVKYNMIIYTNFRINALYTYMYLRIVYKSKTVFGLLLLLLLQSNVGNCVLPKG